MRTQAIGLSALVLAATAGSAQAAAPVLWSSTMGGNDHYYQYVASAVTWTTALTAADAFTMPGYDGYLATATSAAENNLILNLVLANVTTGSRRTWLAGTDQETEGVWKWAAGPEAGQVFWNGGPPASGGAAPPGAFSSWLPGEPSRTTAGEDYISAFPLMNALWNDTINTQPTQGYIVEYSAAAVPEPATWAKMILGFGGVGALLRGRRTAPAAA